MAFVVGFVLGFVSIIALSFAVTSMDEDDG
jgi:hypothetical protein